MGHFANGSLALFESTRYARGHKALYTLEINGENASIRWDLHDLHRLQYFDHSDEGIVRGWRSVHVTDGDQPYMKNWWVPGLQIGYAETFTHQVADFLKAAGEGKAVPADLPRRARDAIRLRRRPRFSEERRLGESEVRCETGPVRKKAGNQVTTAECIKPRERPCRWRCRVALSGVALPGVALPGVALPGVALPGVALPGVVLSGVALPGVALPGVALPGRRCREWRWHS